MAMVGINKSFLLILRIKSACGVKRGAFQFNRSASSGVGGALK